MASFLGTSTSEQTRWFLSAPHHIDLLPEFFQQIVALHWDDVQDPIFWELPSIADELLWLSC